MLVTNRFIRSHSFALLLSVSLASCSQASPRYDYDSMTDAEKVQLSLAASCANLTSDEDIQNCREQFPPPPARPLQDNASPSEPENTDYLTGKLLAQNGDCVESAPHLEKAAYGGHVEAQALLGQIYYQGCAPQDLVLGYAWVAVAASRGHQSSIDVSPYLFRRMTGAEREAANALILQFEDKIDP